MLFRSVDLAVLQDQMLVCHQAINGVQLDVCRVGIFVTCFSKSISILEQFILVSIVLVFVVMLMVMEMPMVLLKN